MHLSSILSFKTHLKAQTRVAVFLCALLAVCGCSASEPASKPASDKGKVSFTRDVKPILDGKCVACHACNDAPDQLDLRNRKGIERGAKKGDPYSPRMDFEPNTLITQSPKTVEQWREAGFFSVIVGGEQSIMGRMLKLGRDHPLTPDAKLPSDLDGRLDSLERKNVTPNMVEFDAYAAQHPLEGMPFAIAGLDDEEYSTLMQWLAEGAKFDDVPPQPTALEQQRIDEWESFLNATDNRSKLVARYIFEHYNPGYFYFDPDTQHFFSLIRSTTPSGQEPVPVDMENIRRRTSPVDGPFWYRLMIVDQTACVKQHENVIDGTGDRLSRIKEIFYEEDWKVDKLPGYSKAEQNDPLNTYAAIPAKSRYKYMLIDPHYHLNQYVWAAACRGALVVSAVQDRFWIFFEDPDTSLYVNDAEYRAELAPYTAIADADSNDFLAALAGVASFRKHREKAVEKAIARLKKGGNYHSRIEDIWPHDMETAFRNEDNAWLARGAVGGRPKTAWVMDFPILQRMAWQGDVSVDLFAPIGPGLVARDGWGHMRRDAELNFLRFLPPGTREALHDSWYPITDVDRQRVESHFASPGTDALPPNQIEFKTDDPYGEFLEMLLEHVSANEDPIGRPQPGDQPDRVTAALRSIVVAADQQQPEWRKFKTMLPEATFLRIDAPGKEPDIYTMTRDRDRYDLGDLNTSLKQNDLSKDRVTIWPGILTAYPNFMFRVSEEDVEEFAAELIDADTPEKFTAVVERWGVRRSSPEFWDNFHSVTDFVRRTDPVKAAVFDLNRYKNL